MNKTEYYTSKLPPKKPHEFWSDEQRLALYATGENIIVSAGAGSGKTAVLTERIAQKVVNGTNVKNLIVLTFTSDAATEMKTRVKAALESKVKENPHIEKQIKDLDSAHIQTFDAFSLSIVKEYHYLLGLPSNIQIGDQNFINMKKEEIFDELLEEMISKAEMQKLFKSFTIKTPNQVKNFLQEYYEKAYIEPDTEEFLANYIDNHFCNKFYEFLYEEIELVLKQIYGKIKNVITSMSFVQIEDLKSHLRDIELEINKMAPFNSFKAFSHVSNIQIPRRKQLKNLTEEQKKEADSYQKGLAELKKLLDEIEELMPYDSIQKIEADYRKMEENMRTVISFLTTYNDRVKTYMKENNLFGFTDIAKMHIRLLKENPSIQEYFRNTTEEILVDECQDTSIIQDTLIQLLSNNNVYMVGDIKQSIYRFRHADLTSFKNRYEEYSKGNGGFAIDLSKNFRSRKEVLANINEICGPIFEPLFGGVTYFPNHSLKYGQTTYDAFTEGPYDMRVLTYDEEALEALNLTKAEAEARICALDILSKIQNKTQVYDKRLKKLRDATYNDFVLLTPSRTDYLVYRKVFEEFKIPLLVDSKENYLKTEEIFFLSHALKLAYCYLDQDFYNHHFKETLVGFLRNFIINAHDENISDLSVDPTLFTQNYEDIYNKIRHISKRMKYDTLSEVIKAIYKEFDVYNKLPLIGDVNKRIARLNYFLNVAKTLETSNITIVDFINYIEYLKKTNLDIDFSEKKQVSSAVSVLTIHKSKGLEYPFCYFPSLTYGFNKSDVRGSFLADSKYGMILPSFDEGLEDSFVKTLIKNNYTIEDISERIRLFYVALTRAKESFCLVMPEIKNNEATPTFKDKITYKTYNDMCQSIGEVLSKYEVRIAPTSLKPNFSDETKKEIRIPLLYPEIKTLDFITMETTMRISSHAVDDIIDPKVTKALEFGNQLHQYLELIPLKNHDVALSKLVLDDYSKKLLMMFYEHEFIKGLNIIKEYHELPFSYNQINGVIDLLLETDQMMIVIDYKTKEIDKKEYLSQVQTYIDYIKEHTKKEVCGYLYSIMNGKFAKVN